MDKKKIIIIGAGVGALAILGGFLYFSFKKSKGTTEPSTDSKNQTNSGATTVATNNTSNDGSSKVVEPNLNANLEIEKLNKAEEIASLISQLYSKKNGYKKSSSKNAVQAHIDSEYKKILALGYDLLPNGSVIKK